MQFFRKLFDSDFMPHGHCYFWQPDVLWSNVVGDAITALSYYLIPILLVLFLKRRNDIAFRGVFVAFAAFILACGTTHLLAIISVWNPVYRLEGLVKLFTAGISMATVGLLVFHFPKILAIPSARQLAETNKNLEQEILAREEKEKELKRSESYFLTLMHSSPISQGVLNSSGHWTDINQAMIELFGYTAEELNQLHLIDLVHPDEKSETEAEILAFYDNNKEPIQIEKMYLRKDGSMLWGLTSVAALPEDSISERSYILQIMDITEQKKVQELLENINETLEKKVKIRTSELQEINEDLEKFTYAITHDLRVPLNNLSELSDLIHEEGYELLKKNEEANYALNLLRANSRQIDNLIVDLLKFSHTGRQSLNKEQLNMNELVQQIFDELAPFYKHKKINFNIHSLPVAYGDKLFIQQVVYNLLSNALKYSATKESISIDVSGKNENGSTVYSIKDKGIGYDATYQKKLFSLFQRLHNPDEFEGTGVGLATCQKIIKKHGGKIWAKSNLGEGATFSFSLPPVNNVLAE